MNLVDDIDIDVRNMASVALVAIAVWLGFSAILIATTVPQILNTAFVAAALFACAMLGRRAIPGAYSAAIAVSAWLFFSPFLMATQSPLLVVSNLIASTLAFGFAGSAVTAKPPAVRT